jgi:hypothetical protein
MAAMAASVLEGDGTIAAAHGCFVAD